MIFPSMTIVKVIAVQVVVLWFQQRRVTLRSHSPAQYRLRWHPLRLSWRHGSLPARLSAGFQPRQRTIPVVKPKCLTFGCTNNSATRGMILRRALSVTTAMRSICRW